MDEVQIIPFSGKTLELDFGGAGNVRFPSSEHGFLLGRENAILEPLLQEILHGPIAPERQPILLYGVLGSGRTHLLKGILETWRKNQTKESTRRLAYYSTCADFARHFAQSITTKTTDEFHRRYQRAKLILFDDLEQLFGKPAAQMELRLLLDALANGECVIVMTAQTLPADRAMAEGFSADLVTRIQGGTAIHVQPPGEAVRRRFLQSLSLALQIPSTDTLLQTTAKELTGTIPQLYAAVVQKYVEAKAAEESLDSTFWQQFSRKHQSHSPQDIKEIAKRTAAYFSLKLSDLKGPAQSTTIVLARSLAVYLMRTHLQLTYKEIGHFFGKRDPSSIRYLIKKVQRDLQTVPELRDHLFRLEHFQGVERKRAKR